MGSGNRQEASQEDQAEPEQAIRSSGSLALVEIQQASQPLSFLYGASPVRNWWSGKRITFAMPW